MRKLPQVLLFVVLALAVGGLSLLFLSEEESDPPAGARTPAPRGPAPAPPEAATPRPTGSPGSSGSAPATRPPSPSPTPEARPSAVPLAAPAAPTGPLLPARDEELARLELSCSRTSYVRGEPIELQGQLTALARSEPLLAGAFLERREGEAWVRLAQADPGAGERSGRLALRWGRFRLSIHVLRVQVPRGAPRLVFPLWERSGRQLLRGVVLVERPARLPARIVSEPLEIIVEDPLPQDAAALEQLLRLDVFRFAGRSGGRPRPRGYAARLEAFLATYGNSRYAPLARLERIVAGYLAWQPTDPGHLSQEQVYEQLHELIASEPDLPNAPQALFLLGTVSARLGKPGEARAHLERLLHEHPDADLSERAREQLADLSSPR